MSDLAFGSFGKYVQLDTAEEVSVELSKKDRWILANQYRILEAVDPTNAVYHSYAREVLERGYELNFSWISSHIDDRFSADDCLFVLDILRLYERLQDAYDSLGQPDRELADRVKFPGFDGNVEAAYGCYAEFLREREEKFAHVRLRTINLNSHMPMLRRYRAMLQRMKEMGERRLTREDIESILAPVP